jgi:hypothetical protein
VIQKVNLTEKANSVDALFQYLRVGQLNNHMLNVLQAENRKLERSGYDIQHHICAREA